MSIEELKRMAEAATPGPWISHPKGYYGAVCRDGDQHDLVAVTHGKRRNNVLANEAYIAAANPAAVLELITEIERVTKQRDELLAHIPEWHCKACNTIHTPPKVVNLRCPTPKCQGLLKPSSQSIRIIEDQRNELLEALKDAREMVSDWAGYASPYFQEKHDIDGDMKKLDAAIARMEG